MLNLKYFKPVVDRFPRLAMTYRFIRDSRLLFHEPVETSMGFKFIGSESMQQLTYESSQVEIVKKCLEKVDVFINVGANIGYYCCIALSYGKKTVAFEPIDLNCKYLYSNVKINHWDADIEIFPNIVSEGE